MIECAYCKKLTTNQKFCSSSCAASVNNKLRPKRRLLPHYCTGCNTAIPRQSHHTRRRWCPACHEANATTSKTKAWFKNKYAFQYAAQIRNSARRILRKAELAGSCSVCGYTKHTEVCHKKPINKFPDNTLISKINDLQNLVGLCPNCHWEFDHGLTKL